MFKVFQIRCCEVCGLAHAIGAAKQNLVMWPSALDVAVLLDTSSDNAISRNRGPHTAVPLQDELELSCALFHM